MRKLVLALAIVAGSVFATAATPSDAQARPWRAWGGRGWYSSGYGGGWYGPSVGYYATPSYYTTPMYSSYYVPSYTYGSWPTTAYYYSTMPSTTTYYYGSVPGVTYYYP